MNGSTFLSHDITVPAVNNEEMEISGLQLLHIKIYFLDKKSIFKLGIFDLHHFGRHIKFISVFKFVFSENII